MNLKRLLSEELKKFQKRAEYDRFLWHVERILTLPFSLMAEYIFEKYIYLNTYILFTVI